MLLDPKRSNSILNFNALKGAPENNSLEHSYAASLFGSTRNFLKCAIIKIISFTC
ncbi:hypothetical protein ACJX0J_040303, partial [Zea mays]